MIIYLIVFISKKKKKKIKKKIYKKKKKKKKKLKSKFIIKTKLFLECFIMKKKIIPLLQKYKINIMVAN